jgi:uncharacterized damage-inducible protein DinB
MNFRENLLAQFTVCFDENGWFVALKNALDGVTAEQAAWKPDGVQNSIWETLSHVNFYNYAYVERFKGRVYEYPTDDNDATFAADKGDEAWSSEVERFNAIMNEFRELIRKADETKFDLPVSETNPTKWSTLISNINAHNAYHGGQIMLLRKLQGAWDPHKGVS